MIRAELQIDDKGTRYDTVQTSVRPEGGTVTTEYVKTRPEVQLGKWGREVGCTISYQGVKGSLAIVINGTVQWTDGTQAVHAYPLLPDADNDDGGVEIEIVLGSKPPTNEFPFVIDGADNLEFYKQPEVRMPPEFPNMRVPEHAIGSYAVYHKNKAHHVMGKMNYGCGKAFHIYRPKAIDALGIEQWGTLDYANGILKVVMPVRFLEQATYPVRIDPTFGHTGTGTSDLSLNPTELAGAVGVPGGGDGTVDNIECRCYASGATNFKGVLLLDSTLAIVTNGVSNATALPGTVAWAQAVMGTPPSVTDATSYYCCFIPDGYVGIIRQDVGPTDSGFYGTNGTYTTPVGGGTRGTGRVSAFANYTASGVSIVSDPGAIALTGSATILRSGATVWLRHRK